MNDLSNAVPMQRIAVPSSHESLHTPSPVKLAARGLDFYYDKFHALKGINLEIPEKRVTALIGPSGCGKSTLIRVINRWHLEHAGGTKLVLALVVLALGFAILLTV